MKNFSTLLTTLMAFIFLFSSSCAPSNNSDSKNIFEGNPPAAGFDVANSDASAVKIADEVMVAMGGRKAYDETRFLFWNFFGSRTLLWDKKVGKVRIESKKDDFTVMMDLNEMTGKVKLKGEELTHPDSLAKYLQKGKEIWINDSYWLVMPFKLKDSGVTLKYVGEEKNEEGQLQDILELVFKNVGVTPQNKYRVFVNRDSKLITQWAFYPNAEDTEPRFVTPWDGYEKFGNIMLSGGRGKYQLTEIKVMDEVESEVFEKF